MSTVIATSVLPDSTANDTLTIGATGDSVVIGGNLLTMNTLQDAGGNAIFVSDGSGTITSAPNFPGALKLISSQTASGSASLAFTSGLDSTYDVYLFKFINMNPATDGGVFQFQMGSSYDTTMTTSFFNARKDEDDGSGAFGYGAGSDQAQGTAYQDLSYGIGNGSDECLSGELHLFAPSSTTYVKQFYCRTQYYDEDDRAYDVYIAGYFNTTSALSAASFKMSSGNMDGTIALYGISKT